MVYVDQRERYEKAMADNDAALERQLLLAVRGITSASESGEEEVTEDNWDEPGTMVMPSDLEPTDALAVLASLGQGGRVDASDDGE